MLWTFRLRLRWRLCAGLGGGRRGLVERLVQVIGRFADFFLHAVQICLMTAVNLFAQGGEFVLQLRVGNERGALLLLPLAALRLIAIAIE